ncbi:hypothetical protein Ea357_285 [Erwinia phage Ea35-70]|uniref:Uncharacterized protein n=5 Tax=Agricanvirus TaxID=1984776 RepID=W6B1W2_9CAUD|nr:hypothetical protein Ea357_285 [Erwinia phage Ea35-70]YP_009605438.1 hypothetical protein FDH97_gp295 [Erwinia phage vB_EamM_Deimos-Minion]AUG86078.1 hypothetical protein BOSOLAPHORUS_292 [Erwinia phage vB_EamM_Bosolaphorus]AUG86719.1 hypothetical protein MADMEL_292 [Erwinia phage vB_EamM_MadMel]AUG87044.1 hypothetical protein MORTIMER_296 [Erwinia phage vB_EamM_Mortimer]AHI60439.1 hypothetical protein Ea357_285 [Erwinia phage Ea35-70]ANH52394.1 hypothetical protein DM_295 [Erwinia phage v
MESTLLQTINETTELCDSLISLSQRLEMLGPIAAESVNFAKIHESINLKVAKIAASMESIEANGINQEAVLEINTAMPGIIPNTIPLNGYTKARSQMNVGFALESLESGKAAMISGSVTGIVAVIVKLFRWVVMTIKQYVKSRRDANRLGVSVTQALQRAGTINEYLLEQLAKTPEAKAARPGFEWLVSIWRPQAGIFKFNEDALVQWWPELVNELEYEYNQISKAFETLRSGGSFVPNIAKAHQSPSMKRFFEALPQGTDRQGNIVEVELAKKQFQENPQRALFQLAERLRYMIMREPKSKGTDFGQELISVGRSIEAYTNVDRLVFDQLNTYDTNNRLGKLEEAFGALYKQVQATRYTADKALVDEFVGYLNRYSEKLNCFVQLITIVSYLDSCSFQILDNVSKATMKYVDIAASN